MRRQDFVRPGGILFFNAHLRGRRLRVLAAGTTATMAVAATAFGAHWPMHGGDAGHSGNQPIDKTGAPVDFVHFADEASTIRTSTLITAGGLSVYPTTDGTVHHRGLESGSPHRTGQVLDEFFSGVDSDIFGSGRGQIAPVDSSNADNPEAYTFQVFNEDAILPTDSDVGLSVFDQSTGVRVSFQRVAGLVNHSVNSSPILFRDALWFIATPDNPIEPDTSPQTSPKLVKVPISDPSGEQGTPQVGAAVVKDYASASGITSPTGLWLKNAEGAPTPYVAVAFTSGNSVRTYSADDPAVAGPASGDIGGEAFTPSVPVQPSGRIPAAGEPVETAPYIYVTTEETDPQTDYAAGGFALHKLQQKPDAPLVLQPAEGESNKSTALPGNPAPTLSLTQEATAPATAGGRIVVTTSCDVYTFNANDFNDVEELLGPAAPDGCADDDTSTEQNLPQGFGRTTAAVSGDLGFVQRNNGQQIAFTLSGAEPLAVPGQFDRLSDQEGAPTPAAANAWGQPAISRRFVQFGDNERLTVYRASTPTSTIGITGPAFAIDDVTVVEGNSGTQSATFTITKYGPGAGGVKVTTQNGTARAGEDYDAVNTTVSFTVSDTTKTVTVPVRGDTNPENDETFYANLSEPFGTDSGILDSQGTGVIASDEGGTGPQLLVSDVVANEGTTANFVVSLTSAATSRVTVNYVTANGTAVSPPDFVATGGTLTFEPGQTTKTVGVPIRKDRRSERVERFTLNLSGPVGAAIIDASGNGLIENVRPDRLRARGLTARTNADTTAPFTFVTTGKLIKPRAVSARRACRGKVLVQVKSPKKTISARRVSLKRNCTYRSQVTFTTRNRFHSNGKVRFVVRFLGNADVRRKSARTQTINTL